MSTFSTLVLQSWIPISVLLFGMIKPRRALLASYIIGWLFLPWDSWALGGMPKFLTLTKINAVTVGPLIGIILFDSARLFGFRLKAIDLPMLAWLVAPFISSIVNGLGVYDGFSQILERFTTWALPYLSGRLYFRDAESLRELGIAVFIGGLIYIPFCLFEMRMSPRTHKMIYGGNAAWGSQRMGGWRPQVFMQNGLALGLWMSISSLVALRMTATMAVRRLLGFQGRMLAIGLLIVTVMCRSLGALSLLVMAAAAMHSSRFMKHAAPIVALSIVPLLYVSVRGVNLWSGDAWVEMIEAVDPARAESIEFRLFNENALAQKALEQPVFGWGTWGRHIPVIDKMGKRATPDGLWIIAFGQNGVFGLTALIGVILLPAYRWFKRVPPRLWDRPEYAVGSALAVAMVMIMIDNLLNAMVNPIFMLFAAGLAGVQISTARGATDAAPVGAETEEAPSRTSAVQPTAAALGRTPPEYS